MEFHGVFGHKETPWNYSMAFEFHEMFPPQFLLEFKFLRRTLDSMARHMVKLQI